MNLQKELENLAKKQQKLRDSYGAKFTKHYNSIVNSILNNNIIIEEATKSNKQLETNAQEVRKALSITKTEV